MKDFCGMAFLVWRVFSREYVCMSVQYRFLLLACVDEKKTQKNNKQTRIHIETCQSVESD